jgi:hypothetical protein
MVEIRALGGERAHEFGMPAENGRVQGGPERVGRGRVGAAREQQVDHRGLAVDGGPEDRWHPLGVRPGDPSRVLVERRGHRGDVSRPHRKVEFVSRLLRGGGQRTRERRRHDETCHVPVAGVRQQ